VEGSRNLMRPRPRSGQIRIIEALLSAALVVASITVGVGLMKAPNSLSSRRTEDMSNSAYSLLIRLAEAETFDEVMFINGSLRKGWEEELKVMVNSLIPVNAFFNMTIYNCTVRDQLAQEAVLNSCPMSNAATSEVFETAKGVAGADVTYTTRRFWILRVHIDLTWGE
jgi:hypothetical protein